jgi:hypothetical protein
MGLNRRNVLVGLGGLAAGGGVLAGTGAFTTVSAERTVSVSTAGDDSAFLQIQPSDSNGSAYVSDGTDGGPLNIDLADSFNQDAITTVDSVLTVTNNSADDSSTEVRLAGGSPGNVTFSDENGNISVGFSSGEAGGDAAIVTLSLENKYDSASDGVPLSQGQSVDIGIEVDTTVSDHSNADTTDGNISVMAQ